MSDPTDDAGLRGELANMERWTAWVVKLMTHAASQADDAGSRHLLAGAAEDAQAMRDALAAAGSGWLDPGQTTVLRSIYELWDANHGRAEQLAATTVPAWYREWRERSDTVRLRLRGTPARRDARELAHSH